jgi:hypothetical protein
MNIPQLKGQLQAGIRRYGEGLPREYVLDLCALVECLIGNPERPPQSALDLRNVVLTLQLGETEMLMTAYAAYLFAYDALLRKGGAASLSPSILQTMRTSAVPFSRGGDRVRKIYTVLTTARLPENPRPAPWDSAIVKPPEMFDLDFRNVGHKEAFDIMMRMREASGDAIFVCSLERLEDLSALFAAFSPVGYESPPVTAKDIAMVMRKMDERDCAKLVHIFLYLYTDAGGSLGSQGYVLHPGKDVLSRDARDYLVQLRTRADAYATSHGEMGGSSPVDDIVARLWGMVVALTGILVPYSADALLDVYEHGGDVAAYIYEALCSLAFLPSPAELWVLRAIAAPYISNFQGDCVAFISEVCADPKAKEIMGAFAVYLLAGKIRGGGGARRSIPVLAKARESATRLQGMLRDAVRHDSSSPTTDIVIRMYQYYGEAAHKLDRAIAALG